MSRSTVRSSPAARNEQTRPALGPIGLAICLLGVPPLAFGLPQGAVTTSGQASVQQTAPGTLSIQQDSARASLDWSSFSIAAGERVVVSQPARSSVLLNRVLGNDPSLIYGALSSNGSVWLINPRGIVFGASSRVDVGGLVASTLAVSQEDLASGRLQLSQGAGKAGAIRSEGSINANDGTVVLVAPQLSHSGSIDARRVGLAAATDVLVDVEGDGLIFFNVRNDNLESRLDMLGQVRADGGLADLRAAARAGFADTVLNLEGVVQARSIGQRGGRIVIDGGTDGITRVAGTVDASGRGSGGHGGDVTVLGHNVLLDKTAVVDTAGDLAGGRVLLGGDFQGANPDLRNAANLIAMPGSRVDASALTRGDGGQVVLWSDGSTRYFGSIASRGGAQGGNGGHAEVSGKANLQYDGAVDLAAPLGRGGDLLLDPDIIVIQNAGGAGPVTGDITFGAAPSGTSTIRASTGASNLQDLLNTAGAGTVTLQARQTITVSDAVIGSTKALTLQAGGDININANVTAKGITLSANDAGATPSSATGTGKVVTTAALNAIDGTLTITNNATGGTHQIGANLASATGTGSLSITGNVQLTGPQSWEFAGASTIASNLSGTGPLQKTGGGNLSLSGSSGGWSGGLTVGAGTVLLASNTAAGSGTIAVGANQLDINNGAAIDNAVTVTTGTVGNTAGTGAISATGSLQLNGAATLVSTGTSLTVSGVISEAAASTLSTTGAVTLGNDNTYTGITTVATGTLTITGAGSDAGSGTIAVGANRLDIDNGAAINNAVTVTTGTVGNTAGTGAISATGSLQLNGAAALASTGTGLTVSGVISETAASTLSTTGAVTLGNDNTYTGITTVATGTLTITGAGSDAGSGTIAVGANRLDINNGAAIGNAVNVTTGTVGNTAGTGAISATGSLLLNGAAALASTGTGLTVSGVISEVAASTLQTSGAVTLGANNTYTGTTTVASGTLTITGTGSDAGGGTIAAGGSRLDINAGAIVANAVTLNGGFIGNSAGAGTLAGNVTLASTSSFDSSGIGLTITGAIGGTGGVGIPAGSVTFDNAANSYNGATTLSGSGALSVTGGNAIPDGSAVSMASGTTLALLASETIGSLATAGTVNGAGTLSAASYTLQTGASVAADLGAGVLSVSGNSTLSGASNAATVNISAGTLTLGSANRLAATADVTVAAGAGLTLGGNQTVNALVSAGSVGGTGFTLQAGSYSLGAGASVGANLGSNTLTVLGNTSLSGSVASLIVNINAGTLSTTQASRLASGADLSVASGAALSLGGNESINTLALTGTLSGSGRTLSATSYTLQAGSTVAANFGAGALTVSGNSALTGTAAVSSIDLASGILVLGPAGRFTAAPALSGSGTLTLGGNETLGSLAGNGTFNLGAFTLGTGSAASTSFNGLISGSGGLNKLGAATTFTLNTAQSYTGATTVSQGTLELAAADLLADGSSLGIASGATLRLGGNETVLSFNIAGTLAGTATLTAANQALSGGNTVLGADLGAGALVSTGNSTLVGSSAATTVNVNGGTLTLSGSERLANGATVTVANGATLNIGLAEQVGSLALSGTLAGSGNVLSAASYSLGSGAVVNADLGSGVLTVNGNSTLAGRTSTTTLNIDSGNLTLAAVADRIIDSAAVTVATPGTLTLAGDEIVASLALSGTLAGSGHTLSTSGSTTLLTGASALANLGATAIVVSGNSSLAGTAAAGTVDINGGRLTLTAADRLANGATVTVANGAELQLGGNDTIGTLNLAGTLRGSATLTAVNTNFTGGTAIANLGGLTLSSISGGTLSGTSAATAVQVNAGNLVLAAANRFSAQPSADVASGATLTLAADQTIGALSGSGSIDLGSATLTLGGAANSGFSGSIGGSGHLLKQGGGDFSLGGSHSYSGSTTVNQGTLILLAADVLPDASALTVASGATLTLAGNDRVASLSLAGTLTGSGVLSAPTYALAGGSVGSGANLGAGTLSSSGISSLVGTAAASTVNVTAGTLTLAAVDRLAGAAQVTVASGATLQLNAAHTVDRLTLAGTLAGAGQTLTASTGATLQAGAIVNANLGGAALTASGNATLNGTSGASTVGVTAGTLTLAAANRLADNAAVSVASGATLALGGDDTVASLTLAGTLGGTGSKLSASQFTLQNGASVLANLGNVGATTLSVSGNSSLAGTADAGAVDVNAGTLTLLAADRLSDAAAVSVASGATLLLGGNDTVLSLTLSGTLGGTGVLSASIYSLTGGIYNSDLGGGALNSNGASQLNGVSAATSVSVGSGTLTLGAANRFSAAPAVTVAAGANVLFGGDQVFGSLAGAGAVNLVSFTLSTGAAGDSTFAGLLSGSGGIVKQGSSTFTLSGNNSYSGTTRVDGGTLAVQGSLASALLQVNAGTLALGAADRLADGAAVNVAAGATMALSGNDTVGSLTLSGTLGGSGRLSAATYALNAGTVNAELGVGALTSVGASALNASSTATSISINSDNLTLGSQGQLGGTALTVATGATLNLGGNASVGSLTGGGTVAMSSFTLTLGHDGAGDSNFAGELSGIGGLDKSGNTSFTLSGSNSYSGGTRVLGGTLVVSGPLASLSLAVGPGAMLDMGAPDRLHDSATMDVQSGATLRLAGNDTVGSVVVAGTLGGSGTLTAASYSLQGGSVNADLGVGVLSSTGASTLNGRSAASTVGVAAGTLTLGAPDRLQNNASVTVAGGATLALGGNDTVANLALSGTLAGTGTLTAASYALAGGTVNADLGTGTLTSNGASTLLGASAANSLQLDSGSLNLAAAQRLTGLPLTTVGAGASLVLGGDQTLGRLVGAGTVDLSGFNLSSGAGGDSHFAGVISGSGGFAKEGNSVFTLSGANRYTGDTTVRVGTLATAQADVLPDASVVTVNAGATLNLGGNDSVAGLVLNGSLGGSSTLSAASYTLNGGTASADLGGGALSSTGLSRVDGRSAASTVAVNSGTLLLGAANRLSALPAVDVVAGATLALAGDQTLGALSGGGGVDLASFTLSTGTAADSSFAGSISGGGGLVKQGSSTFTLTGASSYTGATVVQSGQLRIGDGATAGSLASQSYQVQGTLAFARTDTVLLSQPVSGSGSIEQLGSGVLQFSGGNKNHTGATLVSSGELATTGNQDLAPASSLSVAAGGRLALAGNETVPALQSDGAMQLGGNLTATEDLLLRGPVSSTGAVTLSGRRIEAVNDGNVWGASVSIEATDRVTLAGGRLGGAARDLLLGSVNMAGGGRIEAATVTLGAPVNLSAGTLELVATAARTPTAPDAFLFDKQAASLPLAFAADVVIQGAASRITVAQGAGLKISASGGGSVRLMAADNDFLGQLSVLSGTPDTPWSANPTSASFASLPTQNYAQQSRVQINGITVNVGGGVPAAGAVGGAGILADVISIRADRLSTVGDGSTLVARLPFDSSIGTVTSVPGLTLELTPASYNLSFPFGGPSDAGLRVNVGSKAWGDRVLPLDAGYVIVLPRNGARGATAVLLNGPAVNLSGYRFFFDGAGSQSEIPVFYNGVLPTTPQVESSISATVAVSESARKNRFDESVRTENVTVRLRTGVIAEVGPAPSATQGTQGVRQPPSCTPAANALVCASQGK